MSKPLILRPLARLDVETTFAEYEQIRQGLGARFQTRLQACLESIERLPELYGVIWKTVRAVKLCKFKHVVYYLVYDDRIEVFAVKHGAMHSSSWRDRVV